jgi:hypothetical protein
MIINQERVVKVSFLKEFEGKKIRLVLPIERVNEKDVLKCGFSENLLEGECILPNKTGPSTKKNAEGYYEKHKDQPMETCYRTIEWTRHQWIGGGQTEEITEFTEIPYKRYPRTFHPPVAMELIVMARNGKKYVVSDTIDYNEKVADNLKVAINVFLELFHECHILPDDFDEIEIKTKIIRLNWEILPKGEFPWEKRHEQLKHFIDGASPKNRPVVAYRLEFLNRYRPDFMAIGSHGFSGYLVYGFSAKQIYVFESTLINNATYVFDQGWKSITQLTKKEILTEKLQKKRIIHRINIWNNEIDKLLK